MIRKEQNGIVWLEFELLQEHPQITACVFTRQGGVSTGEFSYLNIYSGSGDDPNNVTENRRRICNILQEQTHLLKPLYWYECHQVHGSHLIEVTQPIYRHTKAGECDALATQTQSIPLMIKHADCQACIFYDPIKHALATVHCGWRGNVANIYKHTIEFLKARYGCNPGNLLVCISPSLGPHYSEFINYSCEFPESFWDFQIRSTYFDLWAISRWQLEQSGILSHHIEIAQMCTYSQEELFFSYRRKQRSGRHATVALLS